MAVTRGFTGRRERDPRLPPGQYDARDQWPVLSAEATPHLDTDTWTFEVRGLVANPVRWSWDQVHELPGAVFEGDIHCVTTWSKLGVSFAGVSADTLLEAAGGTLPGASHVMIHSHTGYTTNLPLADITSGQAFLVWDFGGQPLAPDHGGPARFLVPHLYFWKSAKWASAIEVMDHDEQGFWERNGYHDRGDPWKEERYQGD